MKDTKNGTVPEFKKQGRSREELRILKLWKVKIIKDVPELTMKRLDNYYSHR